MSIALGLKLDLPEDYFAHPTEELKKDERPQFSYQVGVTLVRPLHSFRGCHFLNSWLCL